MNIHDMDNRLRKQLYERKKAQAEAHEAQRSAIQEATYEDNGGDEKSRYMDNFARQQVADKKRKAYELRHIGKHPERLKAIFPEKEKATNEMDDGFRTAHKNRINHYEATERFRRANFEKTDQKKPEQPKSEGQRIIDEAREMYIEAREMFKGVYGFYPVDDNDDPGDPDPVDESTKKKTMDDLFREDAGLNKRYQEPEKRK